MEATIDKKHTGVLRRRYLSVGLITALIATLVSMTAPAVTPAAAVAPAPLIDSIACTENTLPPNDDGSTGLVPLGFTVNFFGEERSSVYVNNNGNVTFDASLSTYTPFSLASTSREIIAPFFGDVDTRGSGSQPVVYGWGQGVYEGRAAFCVNWENVGYYSFGTDKLNTFQLVLVDRSDRAAGDFDAIFNYAQIQWETGSASGGSGGLGGDSARVGFSNGDSNSGSFELPGSGVNGAFLDGNANGLKFRSLNSDVPGRLIFPVVNGTPNVGLPPNVTPDFGDWHLGDVHVHSAGDTNLKIHPECEDQGLSEELCARYLIGDTLARANRFGADWLIFTEHAPWLGFQRGNNADLYSGEQSAQQWNLIKATLDDMSTSDLRGLIGVELGTAVPACTDVDVDWGIDFVGGSLITLPVPVLRIDDFSIESPGHFGVYYTPTPIDDSIFDCAEVGNNGYVDDVQVAGGFGGINHPNNEDGGSPWHCYTSTNRGGVRDGDQTQPGYLNTFDCPTGIDTYGSDGLNSGAFRTLEIVSGSNLPSRNTLAIWDMFLQNGYSIAAVGGSDGHTAPRKQDGFGAAECAAELVAGNAAESAFPGGNIPFYEPPTVGDCIDRGSAPGEPNHGKTGGSGGTMALYPAEQQVLSNPVHGGSYSSSNPADPARNAIGTGATVATNGPQITAQVGGAQAGATVAVPAGTPIQVRVDWLPDFRAASDLQAKNDANVVDHTIADFSSLPGGWNDYVDTDPDFVRVIVGAREGCGHIRLACADNVTVIDMPLGAQERSQNWAEIEIAAPSDAAYVRVEAYYDEGGANVVPFPKQDRDDASRSFYPHDGGRYDFGAFTSPIYLQQATSVGISGSVIDDVLGNPVGGALVEACRRVEAVQACTTTFTTLDGSFAFAPMTSGTYTIRVSPPSGLNRLVATESLGFLTSSTSVNRTIRLRAGSPPASTITVIGTSGPPTEDGLPRAMWADTPTITMEACAGGQGSWLVTLQGYQSVSGSLTETSSGVYTAQLPSLEPMIGPATVTVTVTCPDGGTITETFSLYIDPAGTVIDTDGIPIIGATVTLWTAPALDGPYEVVPNGSVVMSPSNRRNPDLTDGLGRFAWDTFAGWYLVTAEKAGCVALDGSSVASSPAVRVPPEVLDLEIVLDCRVPDDQAPVIGFVNPPSEFSNQTSIALDFTIDDASDLAVVECIVDPHLDTAVTLADCSSPVVASSLEDGVHQVSILAIDEWGNGSFEITNWTVDTIAPETVIESGPPAGSYTGPVTEFEFSTNEGTLECSLDGGPYEPCVSPLMVRQLAPGTHVLSVRGVDAAMNRDETPASRAWVSYPATLWSNDGEITISGSRHDFDGLIHSNAAVAVSGSKHSGSAGVEYVTAFNAGNNAGSFAPAPLQSEAYTLGPASVAAYAPGGTAAMAASPAGEYFDMSGACASGQWVVKSALADGLYYVPCAVKFSGSRIDHGRITIAATGALSFTGKSMTFAGPYVDEILGVTDSPSANALSVSTNSGRFNGWLVATAGGVKLSSSKSVYECGVVGATIGLTGSQSTFLGSCAPLP